MRLRRRGAIVALAYKVVWGHLASPVVLCAGIAAKLRAYELNDEIGAYMLFPKICILFSLYFFVHSSSSDLLVKNNSDLLAFRGFLSKIETPDFSLAEHISAYFISGYRSFHEVSDYVSQHLVNLRSMTKFYRLHKIHILGSTQLDDYIDLWYGISEKDYEDVGGAGGFFSGAFKHHLHKTHPVLHVKFKKEMDEFFYSVDSFAKEIHELYFICRMFKGCSGLSLRAATGLTPSYVDSLREKPYALIDTTNHNYNQLLLSVEVNDDEFNVIETVSYKFGLGSITNYEWLENCYRTNSLRGFGDEKLVTLLSPETLRNAHKMLKWVLNISQKNTYHRPCTRNKRQAFLSLYHLGCSFYDIKNLIALKDISHTARQGQHETVLSLSTNTYIVFDFFARTLNYPAIILLVH